MSYRIDVIEPSGLAEWDSYVAAHPSGTAAHLSLWGPLIESVFGHRSYYLAARDKVGAIVGVLPLVRLKSRLFGDYVVSMPYLNNGGAIAGSPGVLGYLMRSAGELAADLEVAHIEFRNDAELALDSAREYGLRTDKVAMELDLPPDEDVLAKALGSKLRSQIRRPGKEGAVTVCGGIELLDEFYQVFARNMRDLGTPVYAKSFFAAIMAAMPADKVRLFVVRLGQEPVAAGFVMGYKQRLEIPWASSDRRFNRIGVNMLLYWDILRFAMEQGYEMFDFGRSSKDAGTYKFKKQWGARPRQLWWYYWLREGGVLPELTPTSSKFKLAVNVWQRLPLAVVNRIGPHIVKNLP